MHGSANYRHYFIVLKIYIYIYIYIYRLKNKKNIHAKIHVFFSRPFTSDFANKMTIFNQRKKYFETNKITAMIVFGKAYTKKKQSKTVFVGV